MRYPGAQPNVIHAIDDSESSSQNNRETNPFDHPQENPVTTQASVSADPVNFVQIYPDFPQVSRSSVPVAVLRENHSTKNHVLPLSRNVSDDQNVEEINSAIVPSRYLPRPVFKKYRLTPEQIAQGHIIIKSKTKTSEAIVNSLSLPEKPITLIKDEPESEDEIDHEIASVLSDNLVDDNQKSAERPLTYVSAEQLIVSLPPSSNIQPSTSQNFQNSTTPKSNPSNNEDHQSMSSDDLVFNVSKKKKRKRILEPTDSSSNTEDGVIAKRRPPRPIRSSSSESNQEIFQSSEENNIENKLKSFKDDFLSLSKKLSTYDENKIIEAMHKTGETSRLIKIEGLLINNKTLTLTGLPKRVKKFRIDDTRLPLCKAYIKDALRTVKILRNGLVEANNFSHSSNLSDASFQLDSDKSYSESNESDDDVENICSQTKLKRKRKIATRKRRTENDHLLEATHKFLRNFSPRKRKEIKYNVDQESSESSDDDSEADSRRFVTQKYDLSRMARDMAGGLVKGGVLRGRRNSRYESEEHSTTTTSQSSSESSIRPGSSVRSKSTSLITIFSEIDIACSTPDTLQNEIIQDIPDDRSTPDIDLENNPRVKRMIISDEEIDTECSSGESLVEDKPVTMPSKDGNTKRATKKGTANKKGKIKKGTFIDILNESSSEDENLPFISKEKILGAKVIVEKLNLNTMKLKLVNGVWEIKNCNITSFRETENEGSSVSQASLLENYSQKNSVLSSQTETTISADSQRTFSVFSSEFEPSTSNSPIRRKIIKIISVEVIQKATTTKDQTEELQIVKNEPKSVSSNFHPDEIIIISEAEEMGCQPELVNINKVGSIPQKGDNESLVYESKNQKNQDKEVISSNLKDFRMIAENVDEDINPSEPNDDPDQETISFEQNEDGETAEPGEDNKHTNPIKDKTDFQNKYNKTTEHNENNKTVEPKLDDILEIIEEETECVVKDDDEEDVVEENTNKPLISCKDKTNKPPMVIIQDTSFLKKSLHRTPKKTNRSVTENRKFVFKRRISRLSYTTCRAGFYFHCIPTCSEFNEMNDNNFKNHILNKHILEKWNGTCDICNKSISNRNAPLISEFNHMMEVHVKRDHQNSKNENVPTIIRNRTETPAISKNPTSTAKPTPVETFSLRALSPPDYYQSTHDGPPIQLEDLSTPPPPITSSLRNITEILPRNNNTDECTIEGRPMLKLRSLPGDTLSRKSLPESNGTPNDVVSLTQTPPLTPPATTNAIDSILVNTTVNETNVCTIVYNQPSEPPITLNAPFSFRDMTVATAQNFGNTNLCDSQVRPPSQLQNFPTTSAFYTGNILHSFNPRVPPPSYVQRYSITSSALFTGNNTEHFNPQLPPPPYPQNLPTTSSISGTDHVKINLLRPYLEKIDRKNSKKIASMMQIVNLKKLYKCMENDCEFCSNDEDEFKKHLYEHQAFDYTRQFYCCYCRYSSIRITDLVNHIKMRYSNCKYACKHCFYRSSNQYCWEKHQQFHHSLYQSDMLYISNVPDLQEDEEYKKIRLWSLSRFTCAGKKISKIFKTETFKVTKF